MKGRVDVEISIECEACGSDLSARIDGTTITVTPCKDCMEAEFDRGKEEHETE